ncbi:YchF/TatD family DNA exonuclease [Methanocaldococcus infernus]|uniref:Hydrolase, TatD family n=1 Tax=Methanocaldococcus infernus (strain DSM 11812 / JCM 15783 / ME) TaxID=573063 RepID=D5VQW2_METIM|nr:YchF/TatD family DNA exonuclease [Methanocaldococcus infernus]ADG12965.1 hydrolase, TatD family [Methanocaldococcus infernus ME]
MYYVDSHCHIEDKAFNKVRDSLIKEDLKIITSGVGLGGIKRALECYEKYNIYLTLGFHPADVKADDKIIDRCYNIIKENRDKILAVGEIGMDIKRENYERQKEVFLKFMNLAIEINKPIVLHARGFEEELFKLSETKAMFHCYSGSLELAKDIGESGNLISLSTLVCFSSHHKKLAEKLDIDYLTTETDSPYLSPIKGEKNKPENVKLVVRELAKLKEMDEEEVKDIIYKNTSKFFGRWL